MILLYSTLVLTNNINYLISMLPNRIQHLKHPGKPQQSPTLQPLSQHPLFTNFKFYITFQWQW